MRINAEDFDTLASALQHHPDIAAIDTLEQTINLREAPRAGAIDAIIVLSHRRDLLEDTLHDLHARITHHDTARSDHELACDEYTLELVDRYIGVVEGWRAAPRHAGGGAPAP